MDAERFFRYARERHDIFLARREGQSPPWTQDPVMACTRFTNVFRELDRVTIWFRENVRDPLRDSLAVVPATVFFRWFNRVSTGEALQPFLLQLRRGTWDRAAAEDAVRQLIPAGPWVTGSYMVCSGRNNGDKLSGMLDFCDRFWEWWCEDGQDQFARKQALNLEMAHKLLVPQAGLSGFTAYEIVTDLRWTSAVNPTDRFRWAHSGPGATRGGSRVLYGEPDRLRQESATDQGVLRQLMKELLFLSRDREFWPQGDPDWPIWEMREVEHTLCEFDKYERVRRGQGRSKNRFRPDLAGPLPERSLA